MKYVSRPKSYWCDELDQEVATPTTMTIHVEEDAFTGLLDEHGNRIYRVRDEIGFKVK